MKTKHIHKNADISNEINGTFLFSKELDKGLVKKDLSIFSSTIFEDIINEIETMDPQYLIDHGYDSYLFGNEYDMENRGLLLISKKRTFNVEQKLKTLPSSVVTNGIEEFLNTERQYSRYFEFNGTKIIEGRDITLNGAGSVEDYSVKVYGPSGLMGESTVDSDGNWTVTIENTTVGRFQLYVVITGPDNEIVNTYETNVDILDPDITTPIEDLVEYDPIVVNDEPFKEVILIDDNGNVVGSGTTDANGNAKITPVGLPSNVNSVNVSINGGVSSPKNIVRNSNNNNLISTPTYSPINITNETQTVTSSELPIDPETGFFFIAGVTSPCAMITIDVIGGMFLGSDIADENGNYKVLIEELPQDPYFDVLIKTFPRKCVDYSSFECIEDNPIIINL